MRSSKVREGGKPAGGAAGGVKCVPAVEACVPAVEACVGGAVEACVGGVVETLGRDDSTLSEYGDGPA